MEDKAFYIGIYDPIDVRRNILETSKEIVKSMQSYESLVKIREEKLLVYKKMKKTMKELNLLIGKLKERLPQTHIRKVSGKKKFSSELDRLENEIKKVENTLTSLS